MSTPTPSPSPTNQRLLTSKELQEWIQLGKSKTQQLLKSGEIPSFWLGGQYRVRELDFMEYLEKNRYSR